MSDWRGARCGRSWSVALSLLVAAVAIGCSQRNGQDEAADSVLRVAVLPDQSHKQIHKSFDPLLRYLAAATGLRFEFTIPDTYEEHTSAFAAGQTDLGWFGGMTFTEVYDSSGANPLVMRPVDLAFTSDLLAAASEEQTDLADFRARSFAFGPRHSTSGHLMPRLFLMEAGIVPEEYFSSVRYSTGHDETVRWVAEGFVALGVANSAIVRTMFRDGRLRQDEVIVLETSPPFVNYVWATRSGLDSYVRSLLRDAFLALDPAEPKHAAVLDALDAGGYLPASVEDFAATFAAVHLLDEGGESP